MSSIISMFHNASLALHQDQLALNATSDNISNENTTGYARRRVVWNSQDTVSLSGQEGLRTPVVSISAQRDVSLDRSVAESTSDASSASTSATALNALQAVFGIDSSGTESSGISSAFSSFFSALKSVAADTSSSSARQSLLSASQAFAGSLRTVSAQLTEQTDALNTSVLGSVETINQKSSAIATLNGRIAGATNTTDRDTLVDQRTALVEDLATLVGLQTTTASDGMISLYATSGAALVSGSSSVPLTTTVVNGSLRLFSQGTDVTAGLNGGSVGGDLSVRDGAVASTQNSLDALANSFVTAVNTANENGKTKFGATGQAVFAIPASAIHPAAAITVQAASGDDFASASSTEGNNGNSNANALIALETTKNSNGLTFSDVLANAVSAIGTAAAAAQTDATAAATQLTQATADRAEVSGISLDTEAANLTQYQRSYQAEAKLLSVLNEVMASAINLGTNTAVS